MKHIMRNGLTMMTAAALPIAVTAKESKTSMPWWGWILVIAAMALMCSIPCLSRTNDQVALERDRKEAEDGAAYQHF